MRYFFFVLFVFTLFVYPASAEIRSGDIVRNSSCGDGYYKIAHVTTGRWPCYKGSECCIPDVSKNNTCTYIVTLAGTTPEKGSCYYPTKIVTLSQIPPPPPPCGENPPDDDKDGVCNQCDTKPGEPDPKDCIPTVSRYSDGAVHSWTVDPGCSGDSANHKYYLGVDRGDSDAPYYHIVPLGQNAEDPIDPPTCVNNSNGTCGCGYAPADRGPGRLTPPSYIEPDYPDLATLGNGGGSGSGGSEGGSGSGGSGSGGSEGGSGSGGSEGGSGSGGSEGGSGSGGSEGGSGSGGSGGGSGSGGSEGGSGSGGSEGGSGSGGSEGGSGSGGSEGGSGSGNGEGGGNGEGDNEDEGGETYGSIGRPGGTDAYSPSEKEFSVSDRFQKMVGTIKGTQLFNFSRQFFEGVPSGGSPTINFDGGRRYGKHTINLSDTMGSALATFKAVVLSIFAFLSIRAVIMKR